MPNKKLYKYDAPKAHHPGKFPDLSGDGKITKKDILMGRGVIKSGGGPNKVGSKEKFTEGNFAEMHHMKMMGSPLYYGGKPDMYDNPAFMGGNYRATDTNKEVFSGNKEEKKEEGNKKSEGTKRLSAARSRRKEARRNLKADRINRRADRMEARRK